MKEIRKSQYKHSFNKAMQPLKYEEFMKDLGLTFLDEPFNYKTKLY